MIRDYVLKNFTGKVNGQKARALILVFRGPDAVEKIHYTIGHIVHERTSGETIRDTFGDYITDESGKVVYFEPAALAAFDPKAVERDLKLWAEFSDSDGGILDRVIEFPNGRESREIPRADQAGQFQIPESAARRRDRSFFAHRPLHRRVQGPLHERRAGGGILRPVLAVLEEKLGPDKGRNAWESIVAFMAGMKPSETPRDKRDAPGSEKCIAIVYQGDDAVRKIREVLGPTDPAKAPPGSIRKEFGQTIMINAAHASDSAENAKREMGIVQVEENNFKPFIESFYARS